MGARRLFLTLVFYIYQFFFRFNWYRSIVSMLLLTAIAYLIVSLATTGVTIATNDKSTVPFYSIVRSNDKKLSPNNSHPPLNVSVPVRQQQRDQPKVNDSHPPLNVSVPVRQQQRDQPKVNDSHPPLNVSVPVPQQQRDQPKMNDSHSPLNVSETKTPERDSTKTSSSSPTGMGIRHSLFSPVSVPSTSSV
jgi:hypothetical protein